MIRINDKVQNLVALLLVGKSNGRINMQNILRRVFSSILLITFALVGFSLPALSANEGDIVRGAQLYDKWFAVIKADKPDVTHPSWPASNTKKKGDVTWRCKSCHGWDYKGVDGAYGSGSYLTGIKGIDGMVGADLDAIIAILKDDTHQFADRMDDADFNDLALFVSKGQVDMSQYIDLKTKALKSGDATRGQQYFDTLCAQCHARDGTLPKDMDKSLGKQMGNPWEVMHKILNGQPAEQMPALRALDYQITLDLMAHLLTLPTEK